MTADEYGNKTATPPQAGCLPTQQDPLPPPQQGYPPPQQGYPLRQNYPPPQYQLYQQQNPDHHQFSSTGFDKSYGTQQQQYNMKHGPAIVHISSQKEISIPVQMPSMYSACTKDIPFTSEEYVR